MDIFQFLDTSDLLIIEGWNDSGTIRTFIDSSGSHHLGRTGNICLHSEGVGFEELAENNTCNSAAEDSQKSRGL